MPNDENENEGNFDLSGVFKVQQNYLTDLSGSYPDVNNAPVIAKYVLDLQDKSKEVNTSYQNADTSANAVLTQQNDMIDIVSKEQQRLDEKKFLIDQAEMGEQRKVLLTNSNRLRVAEYTKIILCAVAGLVVHVVLRLIKQKLVEEPSTQNIDTLFIILHLVNILVWTITMFYIYVNIQVRSHINFNQLELPPPSLTGYSTPATANYNNLFKDLGVCVEESCCGSDTKWDSGLGECRESFTSYSALGESPQIILPTSETDTLPEPPKARADMSDDELRKDIGKQVAKSFEGVNASIDDAVTQANNSDDLSEHGITTKNGVTDVASLVKVPTADDMSPDMGVKCNSSTTSSSDANNFTTMENYFAPKKSKHTNVYDARNIITITPHNKNTDLIYSKFS